MPRKQRRRTTTRYNVRRGRKIVHTGITTDPERREKEHKREYGSNVRLTPVGPKVTSETAKKWKTNNVRKGSPPALRQ